ncbi:hypothetical protein HPS8415995_0123 [Glaesserella parasuis 84-15995]|nr:hypothetical protein HPS8415995_0123 [Glaesserella parasuis 84-15995]
MGSLCAFSQIGAWVSSSGYFFIGANLRQPLKFYGKRLQITF